MSLRETLRNGLVAVAAVAALSMPASGCVSGKQYQTVPKDKETFEADVMDYDKPTLQQAIQLYVADNGKRPTSYDDIMPYRMVAADLNGNGVLDYRLTLKLYKVNGQTVRFCMQDLTRAEASDSKMPVVSEKCYTLNNDGSVTLRASSVEHYPDSRDKFVKIVGSLPKQVKEMKSSAEKAAKTYEKMKSKVVKPQGAQ